LSDSEKYDFLMKNSYLYKRTEFEQNPNRIDPDMETDSDLWAKTCGNCGLCGNDLADVFELMKPQRLFICNNCSEKKRKSSLSAYRKHVFGFGCEVNQKENFYFEKLLISPSYFRSESACFIPEFNPYL